MAVIEIPGYTYGASALGRSPVSLDDLGLLEQTVLFTEDDRRYLRMAGEVLADQVQALLDVWYGFVGSHPHLVRYFSTPGGEPIGRYLDRVRPRFEQWVRDLCQRDYDQAWLDYQHEIALRHTPAKKNETDEVDSVEQVSLRYLVAFIYPATATVRDFLATKGHSPVEIEGMHQAWFKAVTMSVALWSQAYAPEGW